MRPPFLLLLLLGLAGCGQGEEPPPDDDDATADDDDTSPDDDDATADDDDSADPWAPLRAAIDSAELQDVTVLIGQAWSELAAVALDAAP